MCTAYRRSRWNRRAAAAQFARGRGPPFTSLMTDLSDARALWLARQVLPHEPALRVWLSGRALGGLQVDDVVQETYARLITTPSVDHILNVRNYMFQAARSVVASHVRSARVVQLVAVANLEALEIGASQPSAEDSLCDREELHRLAKAIGALPEPTRTIFRLRRVDGMSQREISQKLGMPESTVEKHISRALLAMSKIFGRGGRLGGEASSPAVDKRPVAHGGGKRAKN